jgi:NADPH:quinone reductase-like Zn-dependent oxidoreductase
MIFGMPPGATDREWKMRQYQLDERDGLDRLKLVEKPDPTPGENDIVIRMRAGSLNYRDLMQSRGAYGQAAPAGLVPLSDGAGEVVSAGAKVTRFKTGDRVCPLFFPKWIGGEADGAKIFAALGGSVDGVLSELVVCDEEAAVAFPDHLSFEEASTLPCAALTAWVALYGPRPVQAGQTVLTLGTGGVSVFAIQFAKAAGATVISTSSSDTKLAAAKKLGADHLINYKTTPEWEAEVLRLTGGLGVDHVIEVGGGGTMTRSVLSCAIGGQIHMIGVVSGMGELNPAYLIACKTVRGFMVGSRSDFEAMNKAVAAHRIKPAIDKVFAFEAAGDAYRHLDSGSHFGKVVVRI